MAGFWAFYDNGFTRWSTRVQGDATEGEYFASVYKSEIAARAPEASASDI